jgi:ubiquinone/menaquinone biosynthesis C-methylase UbiE
MDALRAPTMCDFDHHAKAWDSSLEKVTRAKTIAEEIRKRIDLTREMRALEYGCGTGLLSFSLQPYLKDITLVDRSPGMLSVLKAKIEARGVGNMKPVQHDLLKEPFLPDRYDLIYTLMTLHHIIDTENVLKIFFELLVHPGYFCVADLDREDGSFHEDEPDFKGHSGFDRENLKALARKVGFHAVHISTCVTLTKQCDAGTKTYPMFLMIAEKG